MLFWAMLFWAMLLRAMLPFACGPMPTISVMSNKTFANAAVIGTGMMGPGIALSLALGGLPTTILSRTREGAEAGLAKARSQLGVLEANGLAQPEAVQRASKNLDARTALDEVIARVDLVVESAPEDMAFKQDLFRHMDAVAKPDAVLATNTSGLSITEIASVCQRPERVLTTHFWNPPHLMRLVEIVRGEKTGDSVVSSVKALLETCGKSVVLVKKDRPGQLGNRLQLALMREAVHIVQEGIASVEDVDLAAKAGFGLRLPVYGIFEHLDAVGLDMALAIMDYIAQDLNNEPRAPDALRQRVRQGDLGAKSGQGFYDWSKKDFSQVIGRRDRFIVEFLKSSFSEDAKPGPRS